MKTIHQTYTIKSPIGTVWQALVDPKIIDKWGGGSADMNDQTGTKFSLWDGEIYGTNTKIVEQKELEQDWFGGKWDAPSKVKLTLSEKEGVTTINLDQSEIPDKEADDIADGWKLYYLGPLKKLLEK